MRRLTILVALGIAGSAYAGDGLRGFSDDAIDYGKRSSGLDYSSRMLELGSLTNPLTIEVKRDRGLLSAFHIGALIREQQRHNAELDLLRARASAYRAVSAPRSIPKGSPISNVVGVLYPVPPDAEWASWCTTFRLKDNGDPTCVLKKKGAKRSTPLPR